MKGHLFSRISLSGGRTATSVAIQRFADLVRIPLDQRFDILAQVGNDDGVAVGGMPADGNHRRKAVALARVLAGDMRQRLAAQGQQPVSGLALEPQAQESRLKSLGCCSLSRRANATVACHVGQGIMGLPVLQAVGVGQG